MHNQAGPLISLIPLIEQGTRDIYRIVKLLKINHFSFQKNNKFFWPTQSLWNNVLYYSHFQEEEKPDQNFTIPTELRM